MTDPQVPYSESRTGRGDKWFYTIRQLKEKADALQKYSDAHQAFARMIEDGFKSMPDDQLREIARAELLEFISSRIRRAQASKARQLKQAQGMEEQGVQE